MDISIWIKALDTPLPLFRNLLVKKVPINKYRMQKKWYSRHLADKIGEVKTAEGRPRERNYKMLRFGL